MAPGDVSNARFCCLWALIYRAVFLDVYSKGGVAASARERRAVLLVREASVLRPSSGCAGRESRHRRRVHLEVSGRSVEALALCLTSGACGEMSGFRRGHRMRREDRSLTRRADRDTRRPACSPTHDCF